MEHCEWGKKTKTLAGETDRWSCLQMDGWMDESGEKWNDVHLVGENEVFGGERHPKINQRPKTTFCCSPHNLVQKVSYFFLLLHATVIKSFSYLPALAGRPFNSPPFGSKFSLAVFFGFWFLLIDWIKCTPQHWADTKDDIASICCKKQGRGIEEVGGS